MAEREPISVQREPSQRLALVVAGATTVDACRWLYLDRNAGTHALTPTQMHRCAAGRTSRYGPDVDHQAEYCLSRHHISCPRYLARTERDMLARQRPARPQAAMLYRVMLAVAGIEALAIVGLVANALLR